MHPKITIAVYLILTLFSASTTGAVTFDWATVGNAGNTADTEVMNDGTTGYGSVAYSYRISKTEVTNSQYTEFLNAVAKSDPHGLYSLSMGGLPGGIIRSGVDGSYSYAVRPAALSGTYTFSDKPVTFVSYFDAMRFANWLENGQPTGAQGPGTTEDGVYAISDGLSETRSSSASYFLPSEDEWYKAAYHKNDGVTGNYWDYPTSADSIPNFNSPANDTGNSANWNAGTTSIDSAHPYTSVGAYTLSSSPYGTFDQGGNVMEWNESSRESNGMTLRGVRGGDFGNAFNFMSSSARLTELVDEEVTFIGFRIASRVPEPSSLILTMTSGLFLFFRRRP